MFIQFDGEESAFYLWINGKAISVKGVNRQEHDPETDIIFYQGEAILWKADSSPKCDTWVENKW